MKHRLELAPNLDVKQAEITDILVEDSAVCGVVTATGTRFGARAVIVATGTFLGGKILIGDYARASGPTDVCRDSAVRVVKKFRYQNPALLRRYAGAYPTQQCRFFCDGA